MTKVRWQKTVKGVVKNLSSINCKKSATNGVLRINLAKEDIKKQGAGGDKQ